MHLHPAHAVQFPSFPDLPPERHGAAGHPGDEMDCPGITVRLCTPPLSSVVMSPEREGTDVLRDSKMPRTRPGRLPLRGLLRTGQSLV